MTKIYTLDDIDVVELEDETLVALSYNEETKGGVGIYFPKNKYWPKFEKQMWGRDTHIAVWFSPEEIQELIMGLKLIKDNYYDPSRDK